MQRTYTHAPARASSYAPAPACSTKSPPFPSTTRSGGSDGAQDGRRLEGHREPRPCHAPERGGQCAYGPKVGCRAGLIPSGAPGCWSSRCQRTCGGGDAQRTLAVTARRARSQGKGHTSGRKQQQSSRRSKGERGEQPNDRLEGRRPPSSTHSQGPAKLTRGDRVGKENKGSGGDAVCGKGSVPDVERRKEAPSSHIPRARTGADTRGATRGHFDGTDRFPTASEASPTSSEQLARSEIPHPTEKLHAM